MRRNLSALFVCCSLALPAVAQEVVPSTPTVVEAQAAPTVFHSGWAGLDAEGNLRGQVVTLGAGGQSNPQPGTTVELVSADRLIATAQTDDSGQFVLPRVEPGVYELSATGSSATAVHAVQVVGHNPAMQLDSISIYASSLSPSQIDEILRGLFVPAPAGVSPIYGPLREPPMPMVQSQKVALSNGVVHGRLAFSHGYGSPASHTVKLFKNGTAVDTAAVDNMGYFSIRPTGPGTYDLVVGGIGHGVLGFEVVDSSQPALTSTGVEGQFVAAKVNALVQETLLVPVSMPATPNNQQPPVVTEDIIGPPIIGGGFPAPGGFAGGGGFSGGGGGGFGGGGGGGLGGAGGLLGAAGLAVGIAALASDDDGFDGNMATPMQ